jgi:beta-N-acetylhexosaminidase
MPTLSEEIAQMLMIGLAGERLTPKETRFIERYPVGGFIFFSHNLEEPGQILHLTRSLWERSRTLPPFIAIDQEGGRVHRLPPPFTHFPSAAAVGATANPSLAWRIGRATARELSAVGVNLDFAPVLDVDSNPNNPIIGERSFSHESDQVSKMGLAFAAGLRAGGVIPCGKHFPGHGDTAQDSHLELPTVKKSAAALAAGELKPFRRAVRARIESLMTAHVRYLRLDRRRPATLSPIIIKRLLRDRMGYRGVVFGDDLEMKAVSEGYGPEAAAIQAVAAGVDVLLFCHRRDFAERALVALERIARQRADIAARVKESARRIKRLKSRYLRRPPQDPRSASFASIGGREHRGIIARIQGSL